MLTGNKLERISAAVIGTGFIGPAHIEALRRLGYVDVVATAHSSQAAAGRKNRLLIEIYGSKKSVAWDSERPNELWLGRRDGNNEIMMKDPSLVSPDVRAFIDYPGGHNEGYPDTLKQMFKEVYDYILTEGFNKGVPANFATFRDGYHEIQIVDAVVRSAREERWVDVGNV